MDNDYYEDLPPTEEQLAEDRAYLRELAVAAEVVRRQRMTSRYLWSVWGYDGERSWFN